MGKIWITADTHFGHKEIITYENRPFTDIQEMDEELIRRWNETVADSDTVFHLGDFGFGTYERMKEVVGQLHGRKVLIKGNHDDICDISQWYACGFAEVYGYPIIVDQFLVMQHEPPQYINDATPFFYLYGHVHGSKMYQTITKQSACVSMERWDYKPVGLETIKEMVDAM